MRYKIRGTGDCRRVEREDGVVVGEIHRKEVEGVTMRLGPSSGSFRKVREVWWWATTPDGEKVRYPDGRLMQLDTMKEWRAAWRWPAKEKP